MSKILDKWKYLEKYYAYFVEGISYCMNPSNPELQSLSIFAPAPFFDADGRVNRTAEYIREDGKKIKCHEATIIYWNQVGGYAQAFPVTQDTKDFLGNVVADFYMEYLKAGYVIVTPGCRGKETVDKNGRCTGKAPNALVDLKAGIRCLRHYKESLPGDTDKIISVGTSAGGALSSLLGVSGNLSYFEEELQKIGAFCEENDNIYAAQCYCPIVDLENADMAYEWMFHTGGERWHFLMNEGVLSPFQKALSWDLAEEFPTYLNSKQYTDESGQPLELTGLRSGNYIDYLLRIINQSLNKYLQDFFDSAEAREAYVRGLNARTPWLNWEDGQVSFSDMDAFVKNYCCRTKSCPADDGFDWLSSGTRAQCQLFGNEDKDLSHYSKRNAKILRDYIDKYQNLEGFDMRYVREYLEEVDATALDRKRYLMNPMNYLEHNEPGDIAKYFRICVGAHDSDESFSVSLNLAFSLKKHTNASVTYDMIWDKGHGPADYPGWFLKWMEQII